MNVFFLNFAGPPGPPEDLKVADSTQTSITLCWQRPVCDGGAPIIGYVVEFRIKGANKNADQGWKRCNVAARLTVTDFTVTSLDEKLEYEFRVYSQNQVGMSQPANLKDAVSPKEILGNH